MAWNVRWRAAGETKIPAAGARRPDAATLRGVHLAHARSIPFENLDPLAGTAPSPAPADLMAKLVRGRRGGYCYEHNTLFTLALEALGFRVTGLAARVVLGDEAEARRVLDEDFDITVPLGLNLLTWPTDPTGTMGRRGGSPRPSSG